nr:(d)CMP kinase [Saprospiraceae bacterium]
MTDLNKGVQKTLIAIGGPTASGKSKLALHLARQLQTEIISADSRQIYRGLDVGTAKPTLNERASVRHHIIDHLNVDEPFSAAQFEQDASTLIDAILNEKSSVVMVGGTGLYHKAI